MTWETYFAKGFGGKQDGGTTMISNEVFEKAMQHIAGTCMMSTEDALSAVRKENATETEVEAFEKYLEDNECTECKHCGWFTHPGESCDCEEECCECGELQAECTCDD